MNRELAEKVANAVLYEGYMLYPYRPSAIKNQQRWNFGTLYPADYEEVRAGREPSSMHVECLLERGPDIQLNVRVRFLQLGMGRGAESPSTWDEAVERAFEFITKLDEAAPAGTFSFPSADGKVGGSVRLSTESVRDKVAKLTIDLANESSIGPSASQEQALRRALVSAHVILYAEGGQFISLLDQPDDLHEAAAGCRNVGCFPVLVGEPGARDALLCSPIILYDYPQIAPESAGDFFDGTEMDEMLTLRVLTLTPEEKQAMRAADERARQLLERTERTAREQLARTHGVIRSLRKVNEP